MKNYKIGKRLIVAFGTIIVFLLITVVAALFGLINSSQNFTEFYDSGYKVTNEAMEMRRSIQAACKFIGYATMESDTTKTKEYVDSAQAELDSLKDSILFMQENFTGDKSLVDNCYAELDGAKQYREIVFNYVLSGQNEQAAKVFFESYVPPLLKAQTYIENINEYASSSADKNYNTAKLIQVIMIVVMIVIAGVTLAVTIFLGLYITKSLTKPIREIEDAAQKMLQGHMDVTITYESQDELGSMSNVLRKFMENLRAIIEDESYLLKEMADGNFDIATKAENIYVGDFNAILVSLRQINKNLSVALRNINDASNQVSEGSDQVAQGAQDLADGAANQASSVEELLATITEISGQIDKNARNAQRAKEESKNSAKDVNMCNKEMGNMTGAMEQITEKTSKINNIIQSIEEIATQTNLLSLNAAIEAARAGEAGKGFAVVADEIRKLAEESAKAVQNTTILINETVESVYQGTEIAKKTANSLTTIVQTVEKVTELVDEIAVESVNQSNAISEISEGVNQISSVVETNSATAQESAASSEELSAQAQSMKDLIAAFKLKND